jgi:lactoylglutathione lyase
MLRIEHLGIYTDHLERAVAFYREFFAAKVGPLYQNPKTRFSSYFLEFDGGARLELMQVSSNAEGVSSCVQESPASSRRSALGCSHLAFCVGDVTAVVRLTERLRRAGYDVYGEPRWTGDGYFESVVGDPDGNRLELCAEERRVPAPPAD